MSTDTPQFWVRYVTCLDQLRIRNKHVNKENFLDSSKKELAAIDRGMIIRFSNKAKGFFPLGTFIVVIPKQYCPHRALLSEKGPGQISDITPEQTVQTYRTMVEGKAGSCTCLLSTER